MSMDFEEVYDRISGLLDRELKERDCCAMAARILGDCDPTGDNIAAFLDSLPESVRGELIVRCEGYGDG